MFKQLFRMLPLKRKLRKEGRREYCYEECELDFDHDHHCGNSEIRDGFYSENISSYFASKFFTSSAAFVFK